MGGGRTTGCGGGTPPHFTAHVIAAENVACPAPHLAHACLGLGLGAVGAVPCGAAAAGCHDQVPCACAVLLAEEWS